MLDHMSYTVYSMAQFGITNSISERPSILTEFQGKSGGKNRRAQVGHCATGTGNSQQLFSIHRRPFLSSKIRNVLYRYAYAAVYNAHVSFPHIAKRNKL